MALEPELEHTHRQTLSSQQDPPLGSPEAVIGGRSWLRRGDLASINRHAERLPCLEHKQREGPSAAGGLYSLLNPSEACTVRPEKAHAGFRRVGIVLVGILLLGVIPTAILSYRVVHNCIYS